MYRSGERLTFQIEVELSGLSRVAAAASDRRRPKHPD